MKRNTSAKMNGGAPENAAARPKRKKGSVFSVLLTAVLLVSAWFQPANAAGRKPGEVDGDARLALRRSVGPETCEKNPPRYLSCDADRDPNVSAADARLILRASVGPEPPEIRGK